MIMINTFVFVDAEEYSRVEYRGPYEIDWDGGHAEVIIPIDENDPTGIYSETAERLTRRSGDVGVGVVADSIEVCGEIEAIEVIEDDLFVRVNDGNHAEERP